MSRDHHPIWEKSMRSRRGLIQLAAIAIASLVAPAALAQGTFPDKPVRLVVPYPPGGPTDLVGRLVGQRLSDLWKQPVVVENRDGASGTIGSSFVVRAPADGYTLVLGNNASQGAYELLNPSTAPYRTLRDFAPVGLVGVAPLLMIVGANVPANNIREFIAYVKANPGKVNYASAAIGSSPHFGSELLNTAAGLDMTHIPFNGAAPALQALTAGTVQVYMGGASSVMGLGESGRAKIIGAVSENRVTAAPQYPTLREQGIDVAYDSWYGLLAPAAVPVAILDKINADLNKVLDGDQVKADLVKLGFERKLGTRADFVAQLRSEVARTEKIIKDAKIPVK
jgi:tripartite-type tricarboxylate transporter receptor subunit TctC